MITLTVKAELSLRKYCSEYDLVRAYCAHLKSRKSFFRKYT